MPIALTAFIQDKCTGNLRTTVPYPMLCYETPQVTMAWNNTGTAVLVKAATEVGDLHRLRNVIFTSNDLGSATRRLEFFQVIELAYFLPK